MRRVVGAGDLWVPELVIRHDGKPSCSVTTMELLDGKVARKIQYFGDLFELGPWRAQWVARKG